MTATVKKKRQKRLIGQPICEGIAIGHLFYFKWKNSEIPTFSISSKDLKIEINRFKHALARSVKDLENLKDKLLKEESREGAAILEAHIHIVKDPSLEQRVTEHIKKAMVNAESAFYLLMQEYEQSFLELSDPYFRARYKDIQDLTRRVLKHLRRSMNIGVAEVPKGAVVFAEELSPSEVAEGDSNTVAAFVTEKGSEIGHAAIVARAKGIPFISGVSMDDIEEYVGNKVIVDGYSGEVILNPSKRIKDKFLEKTENLSSYLSYIENQNSAKAETKDKVQITLSANIETLNQVDEVLRYNAGGVGLFRSEFLYLSSQRIPDEEAQFEIYSEMAKTLGTLPLVLRTFDLSGDKLTEFLIHGKKGKALTHSQINEKKKLILKEQIKAVLRAAVFGNIHLLFPMVSGVGDFNSRKKLIEEASCELKEEEKPFSSQIPIGSMVEIPSAAVISDWLAKSSDFFSIGTNDLTQFSLGIDRAKSTAGFISRSSDPGLIRLIEMIVKNGEKNQIPVTICGEMAGNPAFTKLLMGLGIRNFSMPPRFIPKIKNLICNLTMGEALKFARKVKRLKTLEEVEHLIERDMNHL